MTQKFSGGGFSSAIKKEIRLCALACLLLAVLCTQNGAFIGESLLIPFTSQMLLETSCPHLRTSQKDIPLSSDGLYFLLSLHATLKQQRGEVGDILLI